MGGSPLAIAFARKDMKQSMNSLTLLVALSLVGTVLAQSCKEDAVANCCSSNDSNCVAYQVYYSGYGCSWNESREDECWCGDTCYASDSGKCCNGNNGVTAGIVIGVLILIAICACLACHFCESCPWARHKACTRNCDQTGYRNVGQPQAVIVAYQPQQPVYNSAPVVVPPRYSQTGVAKAPAQV